MLRICPYYQKTLEVEFLRVPNPILDLIECAKKNKYQRETEQYHCQFERAKKLEDRLHRLVMAVLQLHRIKEGFHFAFVAQHSAATTEELEKPSTAVKRKQAAEDTLRPSFEAYIETRKL